MVPHTLCSIHSTVPLIISYHPFRFLIGYKSVAEVWYFIKKEINPNLDGLFRCLFWGGKIIPLCIPVRGNIPLDGNNLFGACYRGIGRKKLLKTFNLWSYHLVIMFQLKIRLQTRYLMKKQKETEIKPTRKTKWNNEHFWKYL